MNLTDGNLTISLGLYGGELEVRVPLALGAEAEAELRDAGLGPTQKHEFAADPVTVVWLCTTIPTNVALLVKTLTPLLEAFWRRHDGKKVTIIDQLTGVTRTFEGYGDDTVIELNRQLAEEQAYDLEARRRLGIATPGDPAPSADDGEPPTEQ